MSSAVERNVSSQDRPREVGVFPEIPKNKSLDLYTMQASRICLTWAKTQVSSRHICGQVCHFGVNSERRTVCGIPKPCSGVPYSLLS